MADHSSQTTLAPHEPSSAARLLVAHEALFVAARACIDAVKASNEDPRCSLRQAVLARSLAVGAHGVMAALGGRRRGPSMGNVYLIECSRTGALKIGWATCVPSRIRELQTGAPYPLVLLATFLGRLQDEGDLHRRFREARIHGEWFDASIRDDALADFARRAP